MGDQKDIAVGRGEQASPLRPGAGNGQKLVRGMLNDAAADSLCRLQKVIASVRVLPPLAARKDTNTLQITTLNFDFPPFRVGRQFPPHAASSTKQKCVSQLVILGIAKIWVQYDFGKAIAVRPVFGVMKLALQELRYHFRFVQAPNLLQRAGNVDPLYLVRDL